MPNAATAPSGAVIGGERSYLSVLEAAAWLGVSRVSIWRWISAGRLPATRLGHRTVRIRRADLEALVGGETVRRTGSGGGRPLSESKQAGRGRARSEASSGEHFVRFYEADGVLMDALTEFIGSGLRSGDGAVVVATPEHRAVLHSRLAAAGVDVTAAAATGRYVALDAAETLARFMVDGWPEPALFLPLVGDILERTAGEARGRPGQVRVFGEMVALLAVDDQQAAALRLEGLWNELRETHAFALFCAYPMQQLGGDRFLDLVRGVCAEHSRVIPAESFSELGDGGDRSRAIAVLQQQAKSLEGALAAERTAREELQGALRLRDEFLSIASHELRTPITSLQGHTQLALRRYQRAGHLEPERIAQTLRTIESQADKLARLLRHLLDVSSLSAGKLRLETRPTDLIAVVRQAVASARARTERHPIVLQAAASVQVELDPPRFNEVIHNLLDNAIKYSPDGGAIEVSVRLARPRWAELMVRDHGLGVPAERRGQIFERFYQAHGDDYRSGLGLGLFISRQIVERHGGEVSVEFPSDGGTRVIVGLPVFVRADDPQTLDY